MNSICKQCMESLISEGKNLQKVFLQNTLIRVLLKANKL